MSATPQLYDPDGASWRLPPTYMNPGGSTYGLNYGAMTPGQMTGDTDWLNPAPDPAAFQVSPVSSSSNMTGASGQPAAPPSDGKMTESAANLLNRGAATQPPPSTDVAQSQYAGVDQALLSGGQSDIQQPPPGYAPDTRADDAIARIQSRTPPRMIGERDLQGNLRPQDAVNPNDLQGKEKTSAKIGSWAQRLAMAVLSATKLAPMAMQIVHPDYSQQTGQYEAANAQDTAILGDIEKAQEAQEAQQRGQYYGSLAQNVQEQGKLRPIALKDGSLYDPQSKQIIRTPQSLQDKINEYMAAGYSQTDAMMLAAGGKPTDKGELSEVDPAWIAAHPGIIPTQPDAQGRVMLTQDQMQKYSELANKPLPEAATKDAQVAADYASALGRDPSTVSPAEMNVARRMFGTGQALTTATMRDFIASHGRIPTPQEEHSLNLQVEQILHPHQASDGAAVAALDRESKQFDAPWSKMATDAGVQLDKIADARNQLSVGNAEAQALAIPKVLTALVSGQGSGVRITMPELQMIGQARGLGGDIEGTLRSWAGKGKLTPTQIHQLFQVLGDAQGRILQKQAIANTTLDKIHSATQRGDIVNADKDGRGAMAQYENPGGAPAQAASQPRTGMVSVQIPGQPAGQIPAANLATFKAKHPNAVVK